MDIANQESGSGFSEHSPTDTSSKNISTEILLLRELKNISNRFNSLEEQAGKDRLVIADIANKLQALESKAQSDHVNVILSPRKELVRHPIMKNTVSSVTSLGNVHQTLIYRPYHGVVTQIPAHTVMKLNAVRTLLIAFSVTGSVTGSSCSYSQP